MIRIFLFILAAGVWGGQGYDFELPAGRVVIVSDTNRKFPAAIQQKNFDRFLPILFRRIAEEPGVVGMFHAGDIALIGGLKKPVMGLTGWDAFRQDTHFLRRRGIPIFAVRGNHDYRGSKEAALRNFEEAFPHLKGKGHYSVKVGDSLFLMLDSNLRHLPQATRADQAHWLGATLARADADAAVARIGAIFHHPPYATPLRGLAVSYPSVIREFVEPIRSSPKSVLIVSGHSHQYERQLAKGLNFVVAGGGNTPHWPKILQPRPLVGRHTRIIDFHYLRIFPTEMPGVLKELTVEMVRYAGGRWPVGHRFFLP
ncbi:MAG: metallophosphoesterase [Elusimicrobia bacterium]|nr:metallophosphoesterase [Elusimicrobiota bacterium]